MSETSGIQWIFSADGGRRDAIEHLMENGHVFSTIDDLVSSVCIATKNCADHAVSTSKRCNGAKKFSGVPAACARKGHHLPIKSIRNVQKSMSLHIRSMYAVKYQYSCYSLSPQLPFWASSLPMTPS